MSILERFSKWLQLKVYQFEVTFSVYMFTPAEKLFFCMSNPPLHTSLSYLPLLPFPIHPPDSPQFSQAS